MKTKSFILGGVAAAALIGITPAMAFTHHPGTPAEHRQTEDLNQQQLTQAMQPASAPQGSPMSDQQASAAGTPTSQTASNLGTNADQANASMSAPTDQTASNAAPATTSTDQTSATNGAPSSSVAQTTPVDLVANPPQTLANASVESSNGQAVGAVQRVITDASGKAKMVIVSLLGRVNKLVAIAANQLNFDQSRNVVVAQMSSDQINSLPAAPQG